MSGRMSNASPCGEPEYLKNPKVIKFNRLSDEQHQESVSKKAETEVSKRSMVVSTPTPTPVTTSVFGANISTLSCITATDGGAASCLAAPFALGGMRPITPVRSTSTGSPVTSGADFMEPTLGRLLTKPRGINPVLIRSPSKEHMSESTYLADALRNFDKKYPSKRSSSTSVTSASATATAAEAAAAAMAMPQSTNSNCASTATTTYTSMTACSTIETRTSSSYISAHDESYNEDDVDDQYAELSDISGDEHQLEDRVDVFYEDTVLRKPRKLRKPFTSMSTSKPDVSAVSSTLESGYKSQNTSNANTPRELTEAVKPTATADTALLLMPVRASTTEMIATDTAAVDTSAEGSEQISKLIFDLIGPNSRVGKLILDACADGSTSAGIYDELRACIEAEVTMEDKVATFFKQRASVSELQLPAAAAAAAMCKMDSLRNLDDSLTFVKDHLTQIRADLNEFKQNCWSKIESKVSHTEFTDTTAVLRAKMTYLERKLFNEHRLMRQDIRSFRDKIQNMESDNACGIKNFPFWPFIAFIGAYSIINLGRR